MHIDTSDLLVRFLQQADAESAQYRTVLTAAVLGDSDSQLRELLDEGLELDSDLIQKIAALASPIELASMLAEFGPFLACECFTALFSRVHESTTDTRALRELGQAAAFYHDRHPGSLMARSPLAVGSFLSVVHKAAAYTPGQVVSPQSQPKPHPPGEIRDSRYSATARLLSQIEGY